MATLGNGMHRLSRSDARIMVHYTIGSRRCRLLVRLHMWKWPATSLPAVQRQLRFLVLLGVRMHLGSL